MHHPFRAAAQYTTKRKSMPNVADELAALRAKGSVKTQKQDLLSKGGATLSTPEAEAAALKAKREKDKLGKNEAMEILNKGGSAGGMSQEVEHSLNQTGKKKAEWEKRSETMKNMANQAKEKGGKPDAKANAKAPQAKGGAPAPKVEEPAAAAAEEESKPAPVGNEEEDDVPDLEEADEVPELENPSQQPSGTAARGETAEDAESRQIANRNEKKARKMMTRLGMRPVPHIARVTLKASGGRGYFFIDKPDVFSSTGGKNDTYVIFGEARQGGSGGFGGNAAAAAAQQQAAAAAAAQAGAAGVKGMPAVSEEEEEDVPDLVDDAEAAAGGDEEGIEAKDIDLVMSQASCSRAKAVAALKENDGDLVNAIMSLTT